MTVSSGITSGVALPRGAYVVDLFDPTVPSKVVGSAAAVLRTDPDLLTRLAVVHGVAAWFDEPLDEGLLLADLAAAEAAVGDMERAGRLWNAAGPALESIIRRLERDQARYTGTALAAELGSLLLAGPHGTRYRLADWLTRPRALRLPSVHPPVGEESLRRTRARVARTRSGSVPAGEARPVVVHPRAIAARVLAGEVTAVARGGWANISGRAHPGLAPTSPAAGRLMARATSDGETFALEAFALHGEAFSARLPLGTRSMDDVVIDIYDRTGAGTPTLDFDEVERLQHTRTAWTFSRLDLAGRTAGVDDPPIATLRDNAFLWAGLADRREELSGKVGALEGPTRPTAAELAAAMGLT